VNLLDLPVCESVVVKDQSDIERGQWSMSTTVGCVIAIW